MAAISEQIKTGIVATAGGGQANAVELVAGDNVVATCATAGDSVRLPARCAPGTEVFVRNNGAASCNVFPPVGGTINVLSANAGFATAAARGAFLKCVDTTGAGLIWAAAVSS